MVTQRIVNFLEPVQVQNEQGHRFVLFQGFSQAGFQPRHQQGTIWQVSQSIMPRLVLQRRGLCDHLFAHTFKPFTQTS